ncbi:acetate--CoA ligase family protein [Halomonas sp. HK25]|uniref:acetate--CoA ligase family protein n=1 Tax=Halomonas sp. HK25 TaxID=3394321 RepID=UPI0039FC9B9C
MFCGERRLHDVRRLLYPASVAVVGVSGTERSFGNFVLSNLDDFRYTGSLHLVSRTGTEVKGRPCVVSIDDLPEGIDVAVLTVPASAVVESVEACGRRGIGAAVVFASGFSEAGEEGERQQAELARAAEEGGVMVVGPNCMGLSNLADGIPLTFEPQMLGPEYSARLRQETRPGVAVIAQSGAMSNNLRDALIANGLPVMYAISTGNEAVLSIEDHLAHLVDEPRVGVIALYVEQVRYPELFLAQVARARKAGKPIVMLMPGRSSRARDAVQSHTGALAGNHAAACVRLRGEGVLLVDTLDELFDVTAILHKFPEPPAAPPALLTNSGAIKNCALDLGEDIGLTFPAFSAGTVAGLEAILPSYAVAENPLDFTTISAKDPEAYTRLCQVVTEDRGVGGVMVAMMGGPRVGQLDKTRHLVPAIAQCTKPAALVILGDQAELIPEFHQAIEESGVPFFRSVDRAVRAFARVEQYGRSLRRQRAQTPTRQLPSLSGSGLHAEYRCKQWLSAMGFTFPAGRLATSVDEAVSIADQVGYPVVIKAQSADLPHKSDAGGVVVGLADEEALRGGWDRLHTSVKSARPELTLDGVLVEAMGRGGVELIVGARRDPQWGPVVMVGLGGVWIEALKDVRLLPADAELADISQEILSLKGAALLTGLRGSEPVDITAIAEVVSRVGEVMQSCPEVEEIDINPLVAYPDGVVALDALVVTSPQHN